MRRPKRDSARELWGYLGLVLIILGLVGVVVYQAVSS